MKAQFHQVPVGWQHSFSSRHDRKAYFDPTWHYHPELELVYIVQGEGIRLVGDNVSSFSPGEIVLVGANLPHVWRCHETYFKDNPALQVEAIVLHFRPDCFGQELLRLPEASRLPVLFEQAKRGLLIRGDANTRLQPLLRAAVHATTLDRVILLLSMLNIISESEQLQRLSSQPHPFEPYTESETQRLDQVYCYTLAHYQRALTLSEIAAVSHLSVTAFCRYFKRMTKKTYYDFLLEIRISRACRLLIEDTLPTTTISFDCGFNNVSTFYRHFKRITTLTPSAYKRQYLPGYKKR